MSIELLKKSAPFILLLDIMTLLMFMYMSMPHETDFIRLNVKFSSGIIDGSILETKSSSNKLIRQQIIKNGNLYNDDDAKNKSFLFKGIECTKNSACSDYLNLQHYNNEHYYVFFPDDKMKIALALRYSFCKNYDCDGNIYFDANTGDSFICSSNGDAICIDEIAGEVGKCIDKSC